MRTCTDLGTVTSTTTREGVRYVDCDTAAGPVEAVWAPMGGTGDRHPSPSRGDRVRLLYPGGARSHAVATGSVVDDEDAHSAADRALYYDRVTAAASASASTQPAVTADLLNALSQWLAEYKVVAGAAGVATPIADQLIANIAAGSYRSGALRVDGSGAGTALPDPPDPP